MKATKPRVAFQVPNTLDNDEKAARADSSLKVR
jgi:predicted component of type VI protein secretion system